MAEKVTNMELKVDLQCPRCYKKIKKILCKFPQIRDQKYDEKGNTVAVTVVCCSPEKIQDKLCSKGGKVIKSIEIKKSKTNDNPDEAPKPKPKGPEPAAKPLPPTEPVNGIPPVIPVVHRYVPSHGGFGGGAPWYNGYGVPPPPQPRYDGYYGYGYGYPNQYGSRGYNSSSCDSYFSEENPSACSIM